MSEIKTPTVGRTVNFFPGGYDKTCTHNNVDVLPGVVVQEWGQGVSTINLNVLTANPDAPNVVRYSVQHRSAAGPGASCWDWPEIK